MMNSLKMKCNYLPIETLKFSVKEIIVSKLKTGDIIKVKSDFLPIIFHYGIVLCENNEMYILHNDPDKFNRHGGSIVKEKLSDWIKGKDVVEVHNTNVTEKDILQVAEQMKKMPYHLIHFNCEHFVYKIVNKNFKTSPQVVNWIAVISAITIGYLIIKKR